MHSLLLALKFVRNDFEDKARRDYIMNFVCQGAKADDTMVRKRSLQCLVKVAEEYYHHIGDYIAVIFEVRVPASTAFICLRLTPSDHDFHH